MSPWRVTGTLAVSAGLVVISVAWFAVGLVHETPAVLGWLPLVPAVPVGAALAWRTGTARGPFWRYVAVGLLGALAGVAGALLLV